MKLKYLLPLFLLTAICQAQTPAAPLYTPKYNSTADSIKVVNLSMLSKIAPETDHDAAIMPLSYNWTKDVRLMESIKRMSFDARRMDENGREMPVDVLQHVQNEVLFKGVVKPN